MSSTTRIRTLAAIFAVTTGALLLAGGPSQAAPSASTARADSGGDVCWSAPGSKVVQCFDGDAELAEAVLDQTGTVLIVEGSDLAARGQAGVLATYVLARLYEDASYGGTAFVVSSSSSATCTTGAGLQGNLPAGWVDRVSSFRSYFSCTTRLAENFAQGGAVVRLLRQRLERRGVERRSVVVPSAVITAEGIVV